MTYEEKWNADGHTMPSRGCPCDYGYEEQPRFSRHCARVSCDDCWKREMKEKERDMKYKVGDKVVIVGEVVEVFDGDLYPIRVETQDGEKEWFKESSISTYKTYEQGLEDAWELAKKILYGNDKQLIEIFELKVAQVFFDLTHKREIINDYAPQEALAKLKAYEEEQTIKVGDVVESNVNQKKYLVLQELHNDEWDFLALDFENMEVNKIVRSSHYFKKTGKHVDIAGLLEQIRG